MGLNKFYLSDIDRYFLAALLEIPGIVTRGSTLIIPDNAAALADGIANDLGCPPIMRYSTGLPPIAVDDRLPFLREWVPDFAMPHQKAGVERFAARTGGMLVHPTGAGKSLSALIWIAAGKYPRAVAVTRAGARGTWKHEVERYTTLTPTVLGSEKGQTKEIPDDAQIVIVGWESLPTYVEQLVEWDPYSVVWDEAHKAKSHKRWTPIIGADGKTKFDLKENIAAAAMLLSRAASRRLATTATPIRDRLRDLWAQLDLIEPGEWGAYWKWAARYCDCKEGEFGGMNDTGTSNLDELKKRLAAVSHKVSYSETHKNLPAKRRQVTYVTFEEQTRAAGYAKELKAATKAGDSRSTLEIRLAEACAKKRHAVVARAIEVVLEGGKVVVFTGRHKDCEAIGDAISKKLKTYPRAKLWVAHGGTPTTVRDEIREEYMDHIGRPGAGCILVGTGDAWGESVNLQDTDLALIAMLPWTPGQIRQWEGRFSRLGQKRPVLIHYLVAEGTVDERVAGILLAKLPAVDKIVGDEELAAVGRDLLGGSEDEIVASFLTKLEASSGEDAA